MKWTITPLLMGYAYQLRKIAIYDQTATDMESNTKCCVPFLAFLLRNSDIEETILVDGGPLNHARLNAAYSSPAYQVPDLSETLAQFGVNSRDIKTVILTHLHWDHIAGLLQITSNGQTKCRFPEAKMILQKEEFRHLESVLNHENHEAGGNRYPGYNTPYDALLLENSLPLVRGIMDRFQTIDGDSEVTEGIHAFLLPGHTAGTQGFMVDTESGYCFLTSDIINNYECWEKGVPSGALIDREKAFESVKKAQRLVQEYHAQVLVPHDFRTLTRVRV